MKLSKQSQTMILVGAGLACVWIFASIAGGSDEPEVLPSDDSAVPDASVLASGGMPIDPTWYWGANAPIGTGNVYLQINPDVANFLGDAYTPLFGFVGFAGY